MLNALGAYGLPAPTAPALSPFAYHTQEGLFGSGCVRGLATHTGDALDARFVASHGATLDEWVRGVAAETCPGRCADAAWPHAA
jgi:hypothetical protein